MATGTMESLWSKANQTQIAPIENGNTADRAYAEGEYFNRNGTLYRATTAISSGGTITPGTNCVATTVGADLFARIFRLDYSANGTYTYSLPTGRWFLIYANRHNNSGAGLYAAHITGPNGFLTTIFETSGFKNMIELSLSGRTLTVQVKSTYAAINIINFGGT